MDTSNSTIQPIAGRAKGQVKHPLVHTEENSAEDRVLYMIHRKAYEAAAEMSAGKRVLDWGCNDGYGMEILKPYASEVAGLDVAPHALRAAQQRLPEMAANIRAYDGSQLPFPPASFDMVTSFQVIEHVAEYDQYLSMIREALRPGGMAVFTTPNRLIRLDPGMKPWNPFHVFEFTADDLRACLTPYFSSVEIRGLRSRPEIEAIELARCRAQKEAAKRASTLRGRVSAKVQGLVRRIKRSAGSATPGHDGRNYTTGDFRYESAQLERALDLMAIGKK